MHLAIASPTNSLERKRLSPTGTSSAWKRATTPPQPDKPNLLTIELNTPEFSSRPKRLFMPESILSVSH